MPSKKFVEKSGSKKGKGKKEPKPAATRASEGVTVEGLIEQGNVALSSLEPELAMAFFQRALDMDGSNTNIMDALAEVCIHLGDTEKATSLLTQSTTMAPSENPFKWLYLAQLKCEDEALECYTRGVTELTNLLAQNTGSEEDRMLLKRQIAKAHCSVGELFLTDLCYAENAEQRCEAAVSAALEVDPTSLDANQALVSLRLSQNRKEEACSIMEAVYGRCKALRDRLHSRTVVQDLTEAPDIEYATEFDDIPDIGFFITTTKLLIECGTPELSAMALDLATDLLNDDDENVEIWYIAGVASMNCDPVDMDSARYHISTAITMMDAVRKYCTEQREEFPYDEEYGLLEEHIRLIGDEPEGTNEGDMEVDEDV